MRKYTLRTKLLTTIALLACLSWLSNCYGQTVLFEDSFDDELSDQWQVVGLDPDDYRVLNGALEVRIKPVPPGHPSPMLKVNLPFATAETVIASVDMTVVGDPLERGELAGICLTDPEGAVFTARKTNIDGYFVFAPGEVDFIGQPGEEGDPSHYTVKYWPADEAFGPLKIVVRGDYAHFQVGPSSNGEYRTFFHSAIQEADEGLGFGLCVNGATGDGKRWVRFDNFRVTRP